MLMLLFAVFLHLVPAGGAIGPLSIILPSITLAAFSIAIIERMTRNSMLESLQQDYVRTARAKGLVERAVVYRHALRNRSEERRVGKECRSRGARDHEEKKGDR